MKILILCTGNSCRSQMAQAFLASKDKIHTVVSAGTQPSNAVHPMTIEVMREKGFDLSKNKPVSVQKYLDDSFDFVITVCDGAKESCPVFTGKTARRLHIGFPDPAEAVGSKEEVLEEFRKIRDDIERRFSDFYQKEIHPQN